MSAFWRTIISISLIFLLGTVLRVYQLGVPSLSGDEAIGAIRAFWIYHGLLTKTPTDFYGIVVHSRPPMDIFLSVPAFILGANEFAIRLPYVLFFMLSSTVLGLYLSFKTNRFVGLTTYLMLSISPMTVGWSRLSTVDSLELGVGCLLLVAMDNLIRKKTNTALLFLAIMYGLSFWFIETFALLFPFITYLVIKYRSHFSKKIILISIAVFLLVVSVAWAPRVYFYLFDPRITKIGFGYQVAKMRFPDPVGNLLYYFRTYFPQSIVWLLFIFVLLGATSSRVKKNAVYTIPVAYIASYLIFFLFIYWRHQAYLGNIYVPLVVASTVVIQMLVSRRLRYLVLTVIIIIQLVKTFFSLQNNDSGTVSIWGFRKPDYLKQAASVVRLCTLKTDLVETDVDGYAAAIYFNRKTTEPKIGGLSRSNFKSPAALYFGNRAPIIRSDYPVVKGFPDGSTLYLKYCILSADKQKHILHAPYTDKLKGNAWKDKNIIDFYR